MTPQTYAEELAHVRERLDALDAMHDTPLGCECACPEHMRLYDILEAMTANPTCNFCRGNGCGCCNYTGWR